MDLGIKKILSGLVKNPSKILVIADAWITAKKPTEEQKVLAESRYSICLDCEHFREKRPITGEPYCEECGCPLNKKVFSKKYNECPLKKWKDVDDLLYNTTQKKSNTLL
jgi:hypothetical protein